MHRRAALTWEGITMAALTAGTRVTPAQMTLTAVLGLALLGCEPTVRVEAPQEPITINLNIKLDADVRLKIEEKAEEDIAENPDIF